MEALALQIILQRTERNELDEIKKRLATKRPLFVFYRMLKNDKLTELYSPNRQAFSTTSSRQKVRPVICTSQHDTYLQM